MPLHSDISRSSTLSSGFYLDEELLERSKEKIFVSSWQFQDVATSSEFNVYPSSFLESFIPEPLCLIKKNTGVEVYSNVCTHRANILVNAPQQSKILSCNYHGRCFNLNGQFKSMPQFEAAKNFPSEEDHLKKFDTGCLGDALFVQLEKDMVFRYLACSNKKAHAMVSLSKIKAEYKIFKKLPP